MTDIKMVWNSEGEKSLLWLSASKEKNPLLELNLVSVYLHFFLLYLGYFWGKIFPQYTYFSHLLSLFLQGTVISPSMDPSMSLQPTSMMAPLAQQMSHLSLGSAGTVRGLNISNRHYPFSSLFFSNYDYALYVMLLSFLQFMAANTPMQGAYIPQYAHMQTSSVAVEVRA